MKKEKSSLTAVSPLFPLSSERVGRAFVLGKLGVLMKTNCCVAFSYVLSHRLSTLFPSADPVPS